MDSSDKYKVSEQDAAVWTLIHKLIRAAQHGDPFEASRRVAELIAPILEKAEKWRRVKEMATKSDCSGCKYNHENWCVLDGMCCFSAVVDALEGEGEKG